ncbi:MAG: flavodoxin family protein [Candidatus Aenigmatarchaeota archaeon]|nr:MAG: flavodoxin family protein [Candidatus Aenigmarchaeota archaeon]
MTEIKIIGIVGSPRKGNTEIMVFETLEGARARGAETEMILLSNKNIKFCRGSEESEYDDMNEISKKMGEAKGIVIGSPTYFDNVSGLLKNFIDRTLPLYETGKLKGKFLAVTVVGEADMQSINRVVDYLKIFGEICEMKFVGSVSAIAGAPGSVREDENKIQELRQLGERMLEVIKKAKEVKKDVV